MLVDDQADFRGLMAMLLGRQPDLEVVAEAGSLSEGRRHAATVMFDVAVLDLGLPDGHGADLIEELRRDSPSAGVLVLSAGVDPKNLERATEAGAHEILDKFSAPEEIVGTIRRLGASPPTPNRD